MNIDELLIKHLRENQAYLSSNEKFAVKAAIKEIIEETLKLAAEEAFVEYVDLTNDEIFDYTDVINDDDVAAQVNKESITNVINKIEGL